jgi:glycosyltransferase involved in cell wall biosynthesis
MSARGYDALIAGSDAMREEGLAAGVGHEDQYRVVRYPVDLGAFTPDGRQRVRREVRGKLGLPEDAYVIVSVMRLAPQKAPLDLIAAAQIAVQARPNLYFLLIGGGELEDQVRAEIKARGLEANVRMLGVRRDVPSLLKGADLFALASVWEAMGIVYLEASAVGLPCVGTRVGGAPEAVDDGVTGLLVPPADPRALAHAILRTVDDPELAQQFGRAGRKKAQEFGIDTYVQRVEDVYRGLLDGGDLAGATVPLAAQESSRQREFGRARAETR